MPNLLAVRNFSQKGDYFFKKGLGKRDQKR